MYVHADTFRLMTFYNAAHDSVVERQMRVFHKVRAYRIDMQMVADSIVFTTRDSSLTPTAIPSFGMRTARYWERRSYST